MKPGDTYGYIQRHAKKNCMCSRERQMKNHRENQILIKHVPNTHMLTHMHVCVGDIYSCLSVSLFLLSSFV